ncbi:MAG: T9SS C-terminal target domain-containing protein [Bacteroidetes bacterium]|nr:MAG: T9SS C-terminal target domain-containing protein [Bacteroidota bacterium]
MLFVLCFAQAVKAQVVVTPASLNNLCVGSATYTALGTITIDNETTNTDIATGTGVTMVLDMPAGFELEAGQGSTSIAGGGGSVINSTTVTPTTVTINYDAVTPTTGFTITGLRVRATSAGSGNLTFSASSTGVIAGMTGGTTVVASFTSINPPTVNVFNSGTTVCEGQPMLFVAIGATQYQFTVKQGVTVINTQAFSASNTYFTSASLPAGGYTMEVVGKNGAGCESAVSSTAFTINPLPASPTFTSPVNFCINTPNTTTVSVTGAGTTRWYSNIALTTQVATGTSVSLATLSINTASAGTYTFYLTNDNGTCESLAQAIVINITAKPVLTVFPTATTICVGQTITFTGSATGSGLQYQFVLKKGVTTIATQAYSVTPFFITSNSLIAGNDYTIEVTAKDATNCESDVNTVPFTILPLPTAPTVAGQPIQYCVGSNIATQTVTATAVTMGNTVEWFSDASLTTLLATGTTVNATSLGISTASNTTITRYVTQRDANCRSTATLVTFEIKDNPTVSLGSDQPISDEICVGQVINYTAYGSAGLTYTFELYDTSSPSTPYQSTTLGVGLSDYQIPNNLPVGNYEVKVIGVTASGCSASVVYPSFDVLPKPTVTFNPPATTSFADNDATPVTLVASPIPGAGETGIFSGPGVSGNQFFPNASGGAGVKTIYYTFTGTNGCSDTKSIDFTINTGGFFINQGYCQDAAASPFQIPGFCSSATVSNAFPYSAPASTLQVIGTTYYFNPSAMPIAGTDDYAYWEGAVYAPVCAPYYYYIATNVFRSPSPVVSGNATVCKDEVATYSVPPHTFTTATGTVTYLWAFDTSGGAVAGTILSGQGTDEVTVQWDNAGAGKLRLTRTINYTNPTVTSCPKTVLYNVTINPLPTGSIVMDGVVAPPFIPDVCKGSTQKYVATAGYDYQWTVTDGTILSGATSNMVEIKWDETATSGTVSVRLKNLVTSCEQNYTEVVTLKDLPDSYFATTYNACVGVNSLHELFDNVVFIPGGNPANTYTWNITTAVPYTSSINLGSANITWQAAGTAVIQITETNTVGCTKVYTQNVTINNLPAINFTGASAVCKASTHQYTANFLNDHFYNWTVTNGTINGGQYSNVIDVTWSNVDNIGEVFLYAYSYNTGCSKNITLPITINNNPTPAITGDAVVCALKQNVLYSTPHVTGSTYTWTVTDTYNNAVPFTTVSGNPNQIEVDWGTSVSGKVQLVETTTAGCSKTEEKSIAINPLPVPAIIGENVTCAERLRTYVTPNTGNAFAWSVTGGTIQGSATGNQVNILWGTGASGVVTLKETNTTTTCEKTITQNITINPLPTPTISGAVAVCQTQTGVVYSVANVAGHQYSWDITGGVITAGNNTHSITVTWGTGTTGKLTLEQKDATLSTNCTRITTLNVTINPLPTPSIAGANIVCANSTGNVYSTTNIAGHTYNWSVIGGTITAGAGTSSITVSWGLGGGGPLSPRIILTEIDATLPTNCSNTTQRNINVLPLPNPNITPSTATCVSSTVTYSINPAPGTSYNWTVLNGSILSGQSTNSISVKWNDSGANGSVSVTQTTSLGCSSSDFEVIPFNALPTPAITGDVAVCELTPSGSPALYSTPFVAGSTYAWAVTGGSFTPVVGNPNQINVLWGGTGVGTVQVTETNSNSCVRATASTININPLPNPDITPKNALCELSTETYQTTNNTGSTYIWTVTGASSYTATANSVVINWGSTGTGVLTVEETNVFGCKKTTTQNITLRAIPNPAISGTFELCAGSANVTYSIGAVTNHSYLWTVIGGTIAGSNTGNSITVNWGSAGLGTVQVTQTDNNFAGTACSKTDTKSVNIRPLPTPSITGSAVVCAQTTGLTYSVPSVAGHSYAWSIVGGSITSASNTNSITVDWGSNPTGARVQVVQTDNNFGTNCATTVQLPILIHPLPNPTITPTQDLCENSIQTYQTTSNTGSTYLWNVTGGTFVTPPTPTSNSVQVAWGSSGVGTLTVKETTSFSCEKTATQNITLRTIPNPFIAGITEICEGGTTTYTVGALAGHTYNWVVTGGSIVGSNTTNTITVNWANAGTGNVTITQTDANFGTLCSKSDSRTVNIRALPTPAITGLPTVCAQTTNVAYSVVATAGHSYVWTVVGGTIASGANTNSITVNWGSNPTGAKVQVEETNNNFATACKRTVVQNILINPLPNPNITPKTDVCEAVVQTYQTTANTGSTYIWTVTGASTYTATGNSVLVTWGNTGTGMLTVEETNSLGCKNTTTQNIAIRPIPTPVISGIFELCAGSTGVTYSVGAVAGHTYNWVVTGGSIVGASTGNSITVDWLTSGTGNVSVTQTDANFAIACSRVDSKTVNIRALPVLSITGNSTVCAESTGLAYSVPATAGHTYNWSIVGGSITSSSTANSITVNWGSNPAGARLQVIETNTNFPTNCATTVQLPVLINPLPNPDITPKNEICENSVQTYQTTSNVGSTYIWSITGGVLTSITNNSVVVTWGTAGLGTLSVEETNIFGCKKTTTQNISLRTIPNPVIAGIIETCAGTQSLSYSVTAQAGHTYNWVVTGGTIVGTNTGSSIVVDWGATGIGSVQITQTDNNFVTACSKTVGKTINIRPLPAPVITRVGNPSFEICALTNSITYSTPLVAGHSYKWTVVGGTINGSDIGNTVVVDWSDNPNGAKIQVEQTDNNFATNCKTTATQNIIINPLPQPTIFGDATVCANRPGVAYEVPNVAGHTYTWTVVGGNIVSGQGTSSISVDWGNTVSSLNRVSILQVNSVTLCQKNQDLPILIVPLPSPEVVGDLVVCGSVDADNFYEETYETPLVINNLYVWTVTNGNIVSGQFTNKITVRWDNTQTSGIVRVTQTLVNSPFCQFFSQKNVTINPLPVVDFTMANLCFGEMTNFTPNTSIPNTEWRWTFSEGSPIVNTGGVVTRQFLTTGLKTADLTVRNTLTGCEYNVNKSFFIRPVPTANFVYAGTCEGTSTVFTSTSTVESTDNIVSWRWEFSPTDIQVTTVPTITRTIVPGAYNVKLTVTTNNNCSNTTTQPVRVFPLIAVTPAVPYTQAFDANAGGWLAYGTNNSWQLGTPNGRVITNGTPIWTTGLTANYNDAQVAYVESPCFDLSTLTKPMMAFDYWVDTDNKADGAIVEYTTDEGRTWKVLGEVGKGVDWYNEENVLGIPSYNNPKRVAWTGKTLTWKRAKYNLDAVKQEAGSNTVRFAVTFGSNTDNPVGMFDGFAFDNVYVGERQQRALIEHFTTMEATTENNAVDNFSPEATKLQYHMKGQLFNDNPADGTARSLLYGVAVSDATNTRATLNGKTNITKKFSEWVPDEAERQLLGTPFFDVKIAFEPNPTDKLNVKVDLKALFTYNKDVVLHIVMVEQDITINPNTFKNVVKKMVPSAAGRTIRDDWAQNQTRSYIENITLYDLSQSTPLAPKFYDWNKLKIVAFVQNFEDDVVLQVAEAVPSTIPSRITALADDGQGECVVYPNPASKEVFIGFEEGAFRKYDWEIINLQGQTVGKGIINKGEIGTRIDTDKYPTGMYIVKITNPQNKTSWVTKLVIKK